MLKVVPQSWFFRIFDIFDGEQSVATLKFVFANEGLITLPDSTFEVAEKGLVSPEFSLKKDGTTLAFAKMPTSFKRSPNLSVGGRRYVLAAVSPFTNSFTLRRGDKVLGSVQREHFLTRRKIVDLPKSLPLEVQVFIIWLVMMLGESRNSGD